VQAKNSLEAVWRILYVISMVVVDHGRD